MIELTDIPLALKVSKIIPVHKSNKPKNDFKSYRPIALQANIYKLFDKLLMNNFLPFIYDNKIIPETQYSYKKTVNCESQLIDMIKYITEAFNDKDIISIDIIFLDFSDAFNYVSHDKLIKKLSNIGISHKFLKIIINSLKVEKNL